MIPGIKNRLLTYSVAVLSLTACMNAELAPKGEELLPPDLTISKPVGSLSSMNVVFEAKLSRGINDAECGFYLSRDEKFADSEMFTADNVSAADHKFSMQLKLSDFGSKWYCRAYAANGKVEILSSVESYTVQPFSYFVRAGIPEVVECQGSQAVLRFGLTAPGDLSLTECGLCYGKNKDALSVDSEHIGLSQPEAKTQKLTITGLTAGERYYACSYARVNDNVVYSDACSFTVISTPVIKTSEPSGITSESAVCGGFGIDSNGSEITDKGVVWSTSHTPDISSGSFVSAGKGSSDFTCTISKLTPVTTYYVRAYAINSAGTSYGEQKSFTTKAVAPTVTTSSATNVTSSGATVGGNVTSDGGSSVTERGIVWSTSQNPTTSSNKKASGSGTGSFTVSLSGLTVATTYYVRAYAINSEGTSYGSQISFTTGAVAPTVTTGSIGSITSSAATVGGNVTSDGGSSVTERGVVWSTSQNPTTSSNKKASGSGTGSFTVSLSGLSAATTYYVRAYAINSAGTSYGEQKSFKTGSIVVTSVSLSSSSLTLKIGESYTLTTTVLPSNATDKSVVWTSTNTSVATVSSTGKVTAKAVGECYIKVQSTSNPEISASCTVTVRPSDDADTEDLDKYDYEFGDAPEYVDLGLPSGIKWAICNLGASKPEEYGGYYQWAGLEDVTDTSIYLDWDNCPYHTGSDDETGWTKYVPSYKSSYWSGSGSPDNKTVLDHKDDVAHVKLGGKWRMPTRAEWQELIDNCTWTWTSQNGINGYRVTSKKSGYTSKSIFLPAAGARRHDYLVNVGSYGYYWSSSLSTDYPDSAYELYFYYSGYVRTSFDNDRYRGHSVRPVSE